MTKQQLMAELKARGIAFNPAQKKEELEALIHPIPEASDGAGELMNELSDTATRWHVYDHKGRAIRSYTVADHGQGAAQLAEQFAGKIGGTIQGS